MFIGVIDKQLHDSTGVTPEVSDELLPGRQRVPQSDDHIQSSSRHYIGPLTVGKRDYTKFDSVVVLSV